MLCLGSWLKKPTLEEENVSLKSTVYAKVNIVEC